MKLIKVFVSGLLFLVLLWVFFPKTKLYYLLEEQLFAHKITISKETVVESLFGISLEKSHLGYEGMELVEVPHVVINLYGISNTIEARDLFAKHTFFKWIPEKIETVRFSYNVWSPFNITFMAKGDFGNVEGYYHLKNGIFYATLSPVEKTKGRYKELLKYFKEDKGTYWYEKQLVLGQ